MKKTFTWLVSAIWFWIALAIATSIILILIDKLYGIESLGIVSNVLQVFTVAIAIAAWIETRNSIRRHGAAIESASNDPKATVLIIDISSNEKQGNAGKGIVGNVADYVKNVIINESEMSGETHKIKYGDFIVENRYSGRLIYVTGPVMPDDDSSSALRYVVAFRGLLNNIEQMIRSTGSVSVHLFYAGPVIISFFIGNAFKNNFNTVIYQRSRSTGQYIPIQ